MGNIRAGDYCTVVTCPKKLASCILKMGLVLKVQGQGSRV